MRVNTLSHPGRLSRRAALRLLSGALLVLAVASMAGQLSGGSARADSVPTYWVNNTNDSGPGSLRQAIIDSNNYSYVKRIGFNIPGNGVKTIYPRSPLPPLGGSQVYVDGTTQPGYDYVGRPRIEINGSMAGPDASGLTFATPVGPSSVDGLIINRFGKHGINIFCTSGNCAANTQNIHVGNSYVGTDANGTADAGNGGDGIHLAGAEHDFSSQGGPGPALLTVEDSVISGNGGHGVWARFSRVTLKGSRIGTDLFGQDDLGNALDGVHLDQSAAVIGGDEGEERNVISGNDGNGVRIGRVPDGLDIPTHPAELRLSVLVGGNYIGTNAAGNAKLGNAKNGILVLPGVDPYIGSNDLIYNYPLGRNVISGNGESGIKITGSSVTVWDNYIGTDAAGNFALGNETNGVLLSSPTPALIPGRNTLLSGGNQIGWYSPEKSNVISGNGGDGIRIEGASNGNVLRYNLIGTNANSTGALGNGGNGLTILSANNSVGKAGNSAYRNVIAGNGGHGVFLGSGKAAGNTVTRCFIGTSPDNPDLDLGNGGDGVRITDGAHDNVIGGVTPHAVPERNYIAYNDGRGVNVFTPLFGTAPQRNALRANRLYLNGGPGIDLGADGPTPNDRGDADAGPNLLQNYPVISGVAYGQASATLYSLPNRQYTVDFYQTVCGPFVGDRDFTHVQSAQVTTRADGSASFSIPVGPPDFNGDVVATATDASGNTSELSPCPVPPGSFSFSSPTYTLNEAAGTATITVKRFGTAPVTVQYATSGGTATAGQDYQPASGVLTFNYAVTSQSFTIPVTNDTLDEPDETVLITLSNPAGGATITGANPATLTITDDDATPALSISDFGGPEGAAGTTDFVFDVTLSPASSQTVTVNYATADFTAQSGSDYLQTSGTLTFQPGEVSQPVVVKVNGDTTHEPNEAFLVSLSNPAGAALGDSAGVGTIVNDDKQAALQFSTLSYNVPEGAGAATVTVTRMNDLSETVKVDYAATDGTAASPADYQAVNGTLVFDSGVASQTFTVPVNDDALNETDETVHLTLSNPAGNAVLGSPNPAVLTILDDDDAALPTLSINDATVAEDDSGTTSAAFYVTLSDPSSQDVTVNYATLDVEAAAGQDYVAANGTLTIPAGAPGGQIVVTVNGDVDFEPDETFVVKLSGATGAGLNDNQGTGTITNDDAAPATEKIAFTAARDGDGEIYVMDTDGTDQTRLTADPADDRRPAWSPDRAKIAFSSSRNGHRDVFVMDADGSSPVALTDDGPADTDPAWSPDGTKIAFTRFTSQSDSDIYVMNADGSGLERLTRDTAPDSEPTWSPDGTMIAFTRTDATGNAEIYKMNADGSGEERLTVNAAADRTPSWSPDGGKIAFASTRDGQSNIYKMSTDGGGVVRLTFVGANLDPAWSTDGARLWFASSRGFVTNYEIFSMYADGSGQTKLTNDPAADVEPAR